MGKVMRLVVRELGMENPLVLGEEPDKHGERLLWTAGHNPRYLGG